MSNGLDFDSSPIQSFTMPTPEEPSKVTYQTFVNDLNAGQITHADLYSYGQVDFTYTTKDGVARAVGIPHKANENSLLTHVLSAQSVEYIAHDTSYPDGSDDSSNMLQCGRGPSSFSFQFS